MFDLKTDSRYRPADPQVNICSKHANPRPAATAAGFGMEMGKAHKESARHDADIACSVQALAQIYPPTCRYCLQQISLHLNCSTEVCGGVTRCRHGKSSQCYRRNYSVRFCLGNRRCTNSFIISVLSEQGFKRKDVQVDWDTCSIMKVSTSWAGSKPSPLGQTAMVQAAQ